jgi:hypothetical protein
MWLNLFPEKILGRFLKLSQCLNLFPEKILRWFEIMVTTVFKTVAMFCCDTEIINGWTTVADVQL